MKSMMESKNRLAFEKGSLQVTEYHDCKLFKQFLVTIGKNIFNDKCRLHHVMNLNLKHLQVHSDLLKLLVFLLFIFLLYSSVSGRTSSARIKVVWIYKGTGYKFCNMFSFEHFLC